MNLLQRKRNVKLSDYSIDTIVRSLTRVREAAPIVQCITNFVTVNDCANILLASGGSPTMSKHPDEVCEIQSGCDALVLNMGTVENTEAMILAGQRANELGHPVVLDPVGVGASALRRETAARLLENIHFTAIRGNASEIRYLYDGSGKQAGGVNADLADRITEENAPHWASLTSALAARLGCVICVSGAVDIAADASRAFAFTGGCRLMSRITGSGCMLSALLGAYLGACPDDPLGAAVCAMAAMNAAGDIAYEKTQAAGGGTMTFRLHLIDAVSLMDEAKLKHYARYYELPLCDL